MVLKRVAPVRLMPPGWGQDDEKKIQELSEFHSNSPLMIFSLTMKTYRVKKDPKLEWLKPEEVKRGSF